MYNALDSLITISCSPWHLQRCSRSQFLTYACSSTNHMNISPALDPFPIPVLLPKGGLWHLSTHVHEWWIVARQLCNMPHSQGKLHSLQGILSCYSYVQPVQALLQLDLLVLHARSFLGHKLPILSSYSLIFPFTLLCMHTTLVTWPLLPDCQRISKVATLWQKAALSAENEGVFKAWGHWNCDLTTLDRNFCLTT